jgi:hypothetical protein
VPTLVDGKEWKWLVAQSIEWLEENESSHRLQTRQRKKGCNNMGGQKLMHHELKDGTAQIV